MNDGSLTKLRADEKTAAARAAITARFLEAAETQTRPPATDGPVALPAHLSLKAMRIAETGGLLVPLWVPAEYAIELYPQLASMNGYPLAVTIEIMDTSEMDDPLA